MKEKEYLYVGNCVSIQDVDALNEMQDNAKEVSYKTMLRHCDLKEHDTYCVKLKDDFAVSFHKSKFQGKPCYYFRHSAIEYIFVKEVL